MALIYNTLSYYLEKEKIKGLPVRLREVHNVNSLLSKHRKNSLLYSQLSALFWKQRWHQIPLYRLLCEVLSLSLFPYIFFLERHFINEFTHIRGDLHRCDLCEEVSLVLYKKSLSWKYSNTLNNSQRTLTDPHKNHHRASSFTRIWPNLLHPPSFLPPILPSGTKPRADECPNLGIILEYFSSAQMFILWRLMQSVRPHPPQGSMKGKGH